MLTLRLTGRIPPTAWAVCAHPHQLAAKDLMSSDSARRAPPPAGPHYPGFDTLVLHAGAAPDPTTGARATPIYATTSLVFRDSDHAAALLNMERAGPVY